MALQEASGGRLSCFSCDVTDYESLQTMAEHVKAEHGQIDLLLNVAGILHEPAEGGRMDAVRQPERRLAAVDPEWMARVYAVNAMGPVLTTQAVQPILSKGAVIASLSARVGSIGDNRMGGWWSYRMSKSALNMATKNMANEMKRDQVIAVALHPGTTATDLSAPFQKNVKPEKLYTMR